ncbi:MAG: hypothetical protein COV91_04680 [Candidatus Taylorbacteria bacterium CG11_big_fil_rev_8_21_14_0_20_46_11]|uniref:Uncharacterized protein n=1 Tax=Candidatus Taylorbacteria bacterium CG11_big_fil_rev_8_21_14_0_20_46_11 TaxID=1975025 RepID=A0A2H0KAP1_9BACT|nr:MAG: hypothetical protein COV91_04680 [Candidatus Taylorbacteria bacterium CG11_big_fil_rev_8_21_14_0_20_46_11]
MKRTFFHNLLISFLLLITVGVACAPQLALAQLKPDTTDGGSGYGQPDFDLGDPLNPPVIPPDLVSLSPEQQTALKDAKEASAISSSQEAGKTAPVGGGSDSSCGGFFDAVTSPIVCTLSIVANTAMWISARVLWMSGILLNISVSATLNMAGILDNLPIVDIGWKIIRDISNIVFIFLVLWAGISITLGIGNNGSKAWGLIAHIVLVALFINFSLFITKAVIDASNIAALHFYSLIKEPGHENDWDGGLSDAFMNGLQIQSIYNTHGTQGFNSNDGSQYINSVGGDTLSYGNILLIGLLGSITMLVAAFVFYAASIMFIIRLVTLIMLMVLSPLAFVAWIIPGASGLASQWWSKLWSQSFFAPLYLALAYVVVAAINSNSPYKTLGGTPEGTGFVGAYIGFNGGSISIILNFIIIIGLLIGCLIVAQSLGAKGSASMMAMGSKLGTGAIKSLGGASLRGIIKAPSTFIQGAGNIGKHVGGVGKWMANTRLLDNKLLKNNSIAKTARSFGAKVEKVGNDWHDNSAIQKVRKVTDQAKWLDPRYIEERAGKSTLGNTFVGQAVRSVTTGAFANAKIGNKSLQEAYEEDLHRDSTHVVLADREKALKGAENITEAKKKSTGAKARKKELEVLQKAGGAVAFNAKYDEARAKGIPPTEEEEAIRKIAMKDDYKSMTKEETESELTKTSTTIETAEQEVIKGKATVSEALGKISTKEFIELFTREQMHNPELMNINVLGEDKWIGITESEHFSETEKEEFAEARYGTLEHETESFHKDFDAWKKKQVEYQKALGEREKKKDAVLAPFAQEVETADANLATAERELVAANALRASAQTEREKDLANIDVERASEQVETETTNREILEKEITKKLTEERLLDADGNETLDGKAVKEPPPPDWHDKDIYRAIRNMRNIRELESIAQYMPKLLTQGRFISTLNQNMIDQFRSSSKVGSAQKTTVRKGKSYYVTEVGDMMNGDDPEEVRKMDPISAGRRRKALEGQLSNHRKEFLRQLDFEVEVDATGKVKVVKEDDGHGGEREKKDASGLRRLRYETAERLMPVMIGHKADDEVGKMPGDQRNQPGIRRLMGRGATKNTAGRDEGDDKRPNVEFFLSQLRQSIEDGLDDVTPQIIESLKWMINDRDGQNYANFDLLVGKDKELFEMVKSLYGQGERALHSQFTKKEALKELGKLRKDPSLSYEDARRLIKIAGEKNEYE